MRCRTRRAHMMRAASTQTLPLISGETRPQPPSRGDENDFADRCDVCGAEDCRNYVLSKVMVKTRLQCSYTPSPNLRTISRRVPCLVLKLFVSVQCPFPWDLFRNAVDANVNHYVLACSDVGSICGCCQLLLGSNSDPTRIPLGSH